MSRKVDEWVAEGRSDAVSHLIEIALVLQLQREDQKYQEAQVKRPRCRGAAAEQSC